MLARMAVLRLLEKHLGLDYRFADVAELADALASGASSGNRVEVRILSSANCCCKGS